MKLNNVDPDWSKTILIDFDNVIHNMDKGWQDGEIYGEPVKGALESITRLSEHGFIPVLFTSREKITPVYDWLKKNGFNLPITSRKLPCLAIIDDRAIRFTNWQDVLNYFI